MSKLEQRYLQDYSFDTLRDADIVTPSERQILQYNATSSKWENKPKPVYGEDASDAFTEVSATNSNTLVLYQSLTFAVNSLTAVNKYRIACNVEYTCDKKNRLFVLELRLDGTTVRDLGLVAEDDSSFYPAYLIHYASNLSIGNHTIEVFFGTNSPSATAEMKNSTIEVWRTQ
jgi:hypothetical protein